MCIMFRDECIIRFFKFPFRGDLSLHLHKIVEEISRNITRAENFQRHVSGTRQCWHQYSVLSEWAKTQNCDHKIMYKFNAKSLARYRYKQKQTPWNLDVGYTCTYALLSHQTLSVIAPSNFLKSSLELVCEIRRVPIFVRVFFILSIRNLHPQIK